MASDRALADEMMSISRALAERDSELRVRAKALDSALPELKREADAYGDELRVRVEVHYELLLGKVDDLLHTVQSEVREEALRARGVSSRIAALERENAALRSQLETRSSSLEQSIAIAARERQRSALARQRAKAANVASEAVQRKIVASAAAAAEREEILASEARQLRRRLLRLRTEHRAENEHLQQHAAEAAASAAAAREAAAAAAAAKRTRAQPKARPAAGAHAARSGDALGEGGTPELMAFIEFFLARRAPPSPQDAHAEGGGSASASCLLPGARALLSSSAVPPRLQLLLLELCLDLVSPFISPSLRSSHGASSGAASAADDAAARQLRAPLRDFEGTASALMRAENASVRLRAAMLVLHLDAFRALAPGGGGSGALARASGEATERALATLLHALQASVAAAFSGASSASLLDVDRAGERDGAAAPSGAATEHDAERSGRRAEEYDASRVPPMVAIVRWSAPYVFRLVLSKGASIDRAAALRPGQRATAVRILVSLLCDGAHIVTLLRMCPRYFEDMAAAIKRCELRNAEDVAMLEVLTLLLQKMTTRRTVLAKASARIFSSKLFDCLQELKHRLRAETVERSGPLEFVEMNVDAVLAAINDAARRPPFTSVMLRSVKESSSDRTALLRIQSSAASHRREGVL